MSNSFSGYLIYFYYKFFDRAREANVHEIKPQGLHSQKVLIVNVKPDVLIQMTLETRRSYYE